MRVDLLKNDLFDTLWTRMRFREGDEESRAWALGEIDRVIWQAYDDGHKTGYAEGFTEGDKT